MFWFMWVYLILDFCRGSVLGLLLGKTGFAFDFVMFVRGCLVVCLAGWLLWDEMSRGFLIRRQTAPLQNLLRRTPTVYGM